MTGAHRSFLTAWGPLPTCVVAPRTPINLRAADAESDDGLVLPLQNDPSLFCTNEDWNTRHHPGHLFVHDREHSWTPNFVLDDSPSSGIAIVLLSRRPVVGSRYMAVLDDCQSSSPRLCRAKAL